MRFNIFLTFTVVGLFAGSGLKADTVAIPTTNPVTITAQTVAGLYGGATPHVDQKTVLAQGAFANVNVNDFPETWFADSGGANTTVHTFSAGQTSVTNGLLVAGPDSLSTASGDTYRIQHMGNDAAYLGAFPYTSEFFEFVVPYTIRIKLFEQGVVRVDQAGTVTASFSASANAASPYGQPIYNGGTSIAGALSDSTSGSDGSSSYADNGVFSATKVNNDGKGNVSLTGTFLLPVALAYSPVSDGTQHDSFFTLDVSASVGGFTNWGAESGTISVTQGTPCDWYVPISATAIRPADATSGGGMLGANDILQPLDPSVDVLTELLPEPTATLPCAMLVATLFTTRKRRSS